ncbi:MAG: VWA domain-containing protein [Oscillospiraceae bacterium]|jgi:uncharacterized protein YegL|nr:VWA domain-containing protein [Oscillospiraceae bacterium]
MEDRAVDRPVREASEAHVALALVLDVSGSMAGDSIESLNNAVNTMIRQMQSDARLRNIVDLAIFVFGNRGRQAVYQGFRAIADCGEVKLKASDNSTYVVDALEQALELLRRRCGVYDKAGGSYKPWVVLITDGEFHDSVHDGGASLRAVGQKYKERESRGSLQFFGLGVGDYNRGQLEQLTNTPSHVIDAQAANFVEFFSWVGRSLKAVSTKDVGASVTLPPLQFTV